MGGGSSRAVVGHLRTLYQVGVVDSVSDEQLLEHYLARRGETAEGAFAELVRRHGPMVLGACRRILGDPHAAEDAFQATFLVLARRAASVVRREKVAGWLYIVAVRTAREARARAARRRAGEERVRTRIDVEPPDEGLADELRAILDEELTHLPARHRDPVVLCELEGLSRSEAARRLGIPEGTLSSRLARAKGRLRDRLVARGVSLPAAAISAILIREARAATVPLSLLESTARAATLAATGPCTAAAISASVITLAEGVLKTMLIARLKGIALAIGAITAIASGAVVVAQQGGGSLPRQVVPTLPGERDPRALGARPAAAVILDVPDPHGERDPRPLTSEELSGTWHGERDGIKVEITFRGDDRVTWKVDVRRPPTGDDTASIVAELKPVDDQRSGTVHLRFDYGGTASYASRRRGTRGSAVLGRLERDNAGALRLTILPLATGHGPYRPVENIPLRAGAAGRP